MKWFAQAPANIALIKYMGKTDTASNTPCNSSLSYTLNDLVSFVEIEQHSGGEDYWEPLDIPGGEPFKLSAKGQQRYLQHLARLKEHFSYSGHLVVRSCNNFPMGTGLASSASSFAALTICANRALAALCEVDELDNDTLAQLSRLGSGSSCRSFYTPWAIWDDNSTYAIDLPYTNLIHHVVLVSEDEKSVPSSEAHQRVVSSPLFATRPERAQQRLKTLKDALTRQDWRQTYELCWQEFQDMHQLFASSQPPFSYQNEATETVLTYLQNYWQEQNDGPIVTMDAGPNIHLLFREDQDFMARYLKSVLLEYHDVL